MITVERIEDLPDSVPPLVVEVLQLCAKIDKSAAEVPWGTLGGLLFRHKLDGLKLTTDTTPLAGTGTKPLHVELQTYLYRKQPPLTPGQHLATGVFGEAVYVESDEAAEKLYSLSGEALEIEIAKLTEDGTIQQSRALFGVFSELGWRYEYLRYRGCEAVNIILYEPGEDAPSTVDWDAVNALDAKLMTRD